MRRAGALASLLAAALCLSAAQATASVEVRPVGRPGAYVGFDLHVDGRLIAPLRFSSGRLIAARRLDRSSDGADETLRFTGLYGRQDCGLKLDATDAVTVRLLKGDPYPRIRFHLTIRSFDARAWQRAAGGPCPFHFLAIAMPRAECWQQRGWLNATPFADKFPLLEDVHVGSPEIAAKYSRHWSYTPPLGAQPLPVIGLWAPSRQLYVGLEFQASRLRDNFEKDIATGYCWKQGNSPQFVTLVYPHGGVGYQSLVFPDAGATIASEAVLLYSTDLPATADPNRFVWQVIWKRDATYLPRPPSSSDLSWIAGGSHLPDFETPAGRDLVHGVEGKFQVPGSRLVAGWYKHKEDFVPHLVRDADSRAIDSVTKDLRYLLSKMKRFRVQGDDCIYWEKPLEGRWTDDWGGAPATTLHNSDAFFVARVWLDLYRLRETPVAAGIIADLGLKPEQVLDIVEGCLNWARHLAWTRNEFADVPSSPFAIGGTLTSAFCLDYYFAFRGDPARRERADQALDLARTFVYRYLTMWPSDNDRGDRFDAAFLWEPNSGRDWCGAACANEVTWCLDTLAMTAVNTADPILVHALRGTLDRWHLLYKERYHDSLADYKSDALTEGYALYDDTVYGARGTRAPWGWGPALPMLEPVGDSTIRVLAGMKTALAFGRRDVLPRVVDYACSAPGRFRLTLQWKAAGPQDVSLTFPFADLSGASVWIERGGERDVLTEGKDFRRPPQALWSLYLVGVRDGDTVCVGDAPPGPPAPWAQPLQGEAAISPGDAFRTLALDVAQPVEQDWSNLDSWAGMPGGLRWAYGVPLRLGLPRPRAAAQFARLAEPITGPALALIAYSSGGGKAPSLALEAGATAPVDIGRESLAWEAWPPIFTRRMVIAPAIIPAGSAATGVDPGARLVFAITALRGTGSLAESCLRTLESAGLEWRSIQETERRIAALGDLGRSRELARLAVLPYGSPSGNLWRLLAKSRLQSQVSQPAPEALAQPDGLSPARFSVALDADSERYIKTVKTDDDAANAVIEYVRGGGLLVLAADGPFPMYYGETPQGAPSDPLPPKLGLPITMGFEHPPEGEQISLIANPHQSVLSGIPAQVAFPEGDQRLRAVDRTQLPADAAYTPIYTARGRDGADYGDAAGLLKLPGGGRVLYVWFGLLRDSEAGPAIADSLLRAILDALPPRSP